MSTVIPFSRQPLRHTLSTLQFLVNFVNMRGIISFIAVSVLLAFGDGFPLERRDSSQTVLTLAAGPISGIKVSSNNYKFLGIPYAQAPVGNLRFAPPVPFPRACMADP